MKQSFSFILTIVSISCITAENITCNIEDPCECVVDAPCIIECINCNERPEPIQCHKNNSCTIQCIGQRSCSDLIFHGPTDRNLNIICDGQDACDSSVIVNTNAADVTVSCNQKHGCLLLNLSCGSGDCSITCDGKADACTDVAITSDNARSLTCAGEFCTDGISIQTYTAFPTQSPTTTAAPTRSPTTLPTFTPTVYPTMVLTPLTTMNSWLTSTVSPSNPPTSYSVVAQTTSPPFTQEPLSTNTPTSRPTSRPTDAVNKQTESETTTTTFVHVSNSDFTTSDTVFRQKDKKETIILFGSLFGAFNLFMCVCIACGIWYYVKKRKISNDSNKFNDANDHRSDVNMIDNNNGLSGQQIQLAEDSDDGDDIVLQQPNALGQQVSSYSERNSIIMGGYTVEGIEGDLASNVNAISYKKAMKVIDALIIGPNTNDVIIEEDSMSTSTQSSIFVNTTKGQNVVDVNEDEDEKHDIINDHQVMMRLKSIQSQASLAKYDPEVIDDENEEQRGNMDTSNYIGGVLNLQMNNAVNNVEDYTEEGN